MRIDELEVEALEPNPVCERESPGLGVAFVAEVERATGPERRRRRSPF